MSAGQSIMGGRLREEMAGVLREYGGEGTSAKRKPWSLGKIDKKTIRRLRQLIDAE